MELQSRTARAHQGESTSVHERGNHAPACRDVFLAQKDTQLLDLERTNRTNEIAAVAAAENWRSRVKMHATETMEAR